MPAPTNKAVKILSFIAIMALSLGTMTLILYFTGQFENKEKQENTSQASTEVPESNGTQDRGVEPPPSPTVPENVSKDVPSKSQRSDSKEIAKLFAKAYYNYDSDNQMAYIEKSKPFITYEFYDYIKDNPRRNPLDRIKTTAKEIDIYPVDSDTEYEIAWNAIITGEAVSSDGTKTQEESSLWIVLEKEDSTWKVKGAKFDAW